MVSELEALQAAMTVTLPLPAGTVALNAPQWLRWRASAVTPAGILGYWLQGGWRSLSRIIHQVGAR